MKHILILSLIGVLTSCAQIQTPPEDFQEDGVIKPIEQEEVVMEEKNNIPLEKYEERVTKKPFGIHITKTNSPVSPERFSGYHSGVDFEILPGEEDTDVEVRAICTGPLVMKKRATGYG